MSSLLSTFENQYLYLTSRNKKDTKTEFVNLPYDFTVQLVKTLCIDNTWQIGLLNLELFFPKTSINTSRIYIETDIVVPSFCPNSMRHVLFAFLNPHTQGVQHLDPYLIRYVNIGDVKELTQISFRVTDDNGELINVLTKSLSISLHLKRNI